MADSDLAGAAAVRAVSFSDFCNGDVPYAGEGNICADPLVEQSV